MMSEDYTPWLLEVNSSPGMLPSSIDKAKLCSSVIEDTIKGIGLYSMWLLCYLDTLKMELDFPIVESGGVSTEALVLHSSKTLSAGVIYRSYSWIHILSLYTICFFP